MYKDRARVPTIEVEGQSSNVPKDEVKIPMSIKIGLELKCLEG